ncbi:MAG: TIGR00296 family protein [Candidatus Heimdallarchaeota archaeon]
MLEAKILVRLAREAIKTYLESDQPIDSPSEISESLKKKSGVFCTLKTYPNLQLRGCIGRPYPEFPLVEALIDSAIDAATRDPRFPRVTLQELENLVIDVTVLTPPTLIQVENPEEYFEKIHIGRDGLLIERGPNRGLLLPQVPVEWQWDVEEFLVHLSNKAFLPANAWKKPDTKIYRFQGEIWGETTPKGEIRKQ